MKINIGQLNILFVYYKVNTRMLDNLLNTPFFHLKTRKENNKQTNKQKQNIYFL